MFLKKIQAKYKITAIRRGIGVPLKYQVLAVENKKFKITTDIATIAVVDAKFAKSKGAMFFEEKNRIERITTPVGELLVTLNVEGKKIESIIQSSGEIIVGDFVAMFSSLVEVDDGPLIEQSDREALRAFHQWTETHKKTDKYFALHTGYDGSFNVEISIKKYKDKKLGATAISADNINYQHLADWLANGVEYIDEYTVDDLMKMGLSKTQANKILNKAEDTLVELFNLSLVPDNGRSLISWAKKVLK